MLYLFNATTQGASTLIIMTQNITTLSIMGVIETLSINYTQGNVMLSVTFLLFFYISLCRVSSC
jgi:hypothetical protein